MSWPVKLATSILIKILPWLIAHVMEWLEVRERISKQNKDIDKKLQALKDAYAKSFDGTPVTPEQREELKSAIRDFIGGASGGLPVDAVAAPLEPRAQAVEAPSESDRRVLAVTGKCVREFQHRKGEYCKSCGKTS